MKSKYLNTIGTGLLRKIGQLLLVSRSYCKADVDNMNENCIKDWVELRLHFRNKQLVPRTSMCCGGNKLLFKFMVQTTFLMLNLIKFENS